MQILFTIPSQYSGEKCLILMPFFILSYITCNPYALLLRSFVYLLCLKKSLSASQRGTFMSIICYIKFLFFPAFNS